MQKEISLHKLIYKNYLSSSLVPIFAIEILLLILYFGVSYFITQKSQELLQDEATQNLLEISKRKAANINQQLQEVSRLSMLMRKDHEHFFATNDCYLPNAEPLFGYHENGVYHKLEDNGGSSLYYTSATKIKQKEEQKSRCSEMLDPLMKNIVDTHPLITQAYLNTYDSMNRLYPFMKDAPQQYGAILDVRKYNFYYLADIEHNPKRQSVWTSAYLDPAGQGWMISNVTPIYRGDFLEGVSGLDVTIDSFVRNVLESELPWDASAFMMDRDGVVLAMPQKIESLFGLKELKEHTYEKNIDTTIEKPKNFNLSYIEALFEGEKEFAELEIANKEYIIVSQTIAETEWKMMTMLDKSVLFAPIQRLKQQIDLLGYVVIALMILFYILFFLYLQRKSKTLAHKIVAPIEQLSLLSKDLGKDTKALIQSDSGIKEVEELTENFNTLSKELDARTEAYIEAKLQEKMHEKDAEIAYRVGLFESASSYLHNIGNAITILNAKVRLLGNITQALSKTSLGFDKLRLLLNESSATEEQKESIGVYIGEFDRAMSENIVEELESIYGAISETMHHANESIRHQQDDFNDSNAILSNYEQRFSLKSLLESLAEDYHLSCATKGIRMSLEVEDIEITTVKFQLHSGLSNIFKNAIESIEASEQKGRGEIRVMLRRTSSAIVISISDNGAGVYLENRSKLFSSGFTTKKDGHGLGLHAFNNFLHNHNGTIELQSPGKEMGATITITLKEKQE